MSDRVKTWGKFFQIMKLILVKKESDGVYEYVRDIDNEVSIPI